MPIGIIIAVLDIALIVHAAKTGRFMPWGFVILFLPGIGALAYVVVELLPEWLGAYKVRQARGRIAGAINPTGRYRQLKEELEIVDTIANRSALAGECLALRNYDEALAQYDKILANPLGEEPSFMLGKARAEFGFGRGRSGDRHARRAQAALARAPIGRRPFALCDGAGKGRKQR